MRVAGAAAAEGCLAGASGRRADAQPLLLLGLLALVVGGLEEQPVHPVGDLRAHPSGKASILLNTADIAAPENRRVTIVSKAP